MERHFDEELIHLKQNLLKMSDLSQEMISLSMRALIERKSEYIDQLFLIESDVNHLEIEIEEEALRLLALRQPAARDLRLLTAALKINNTLERVADQAVNIAERGRELLKEPPLKPLIDIPNMASKAQLMLKRSIDAFVHHDTKLAKQVCEHDDVVDDLNNQIFRELLTYAMEDTRAISRAISLILVARNIERIADHATNIAEEVVFIEEGKNIKHSAQAETLS